MKHVIALLALIVKIASILLGVLLICISAIGIIVNLMQVGSLGAGGLVLVLTLGLLYGYLGIKLIKLKPLARYWAAALCIINAVPAYLVGPVLFRSEPQPHHLLWLFPVVMVLFALLVWWPESWVKVSSEANKKSK